MSLKSDTINFDVVWTPMEQLLVNIMHQNYGDVTIERWQESFFDVYKICVAQPESLVGVLYSRLKLLLQLHVQDLCKRILSCGSQNLLENYYIEWSTYRKAAGYFDKLFNYLNTQHLKKIKKPMPADTSSDSVCHPGLEVKDLCLFLWNQEMITPLKDEIVYMLMREIDLERKGQTVKQSVIKGIVDSLAEVEEYKKEDTLELYRETFEKDFINATSAYYRAEAECLRAKLNCSDYMKKVLQIIDLETLRCKKFIHHSSKDKVINEVRARMVADHSRFLYKESEHMVASDCWQDLQAMYKLLKPIEGGLKTLIQQVQTRISQVGLEAIRQITTSDNPPRAFVESFIQVYRKHSDLVATTFNSDQLFIGALDKACSAIINYRINPQQPCRSPELLAKYCDNLLRKPTSGLSSSGSANRGLTDEEIDEKLGLAIIVFKYIDDKDIFQKFYSKNMARRLIFSQLSLLGHEESMINKLKLVCGYEFTAKLHRMYTDIGVSNELKSGFEEDLRNKEEQLGISFSIYVLQAGSWPLGQNPVTSFALPEVFSHCVKAFETYYCKRFNGRVLTWLYHHCTADLKLCYTDKRQYSVSMQTFHAAILLLFEKCDELTYEEISHSTQLSDEQLSKHLQGLLEVKILLSTDEASPSSSGPRASTSDQAAGSQQVACKQDDNNSPTAPQYSFTPATRLRLNLDFTSKRSKFKIAAVQRDNQYQHIREQTESEQTHSSIDEDRKLYIQAAIVRVMKSRKSAKHNHLIQEVIGLTKNHFTPSVPMIKKCIEVLIEKQYLERKSSAADEYKYVA